MISVGKVRAAGLGYYLGHAWATGEAEWAEPAGEAAQGLTDDSDQASRCGGREVPGRWWARTTDSLAPYGLTPGQPVTRAALEAVLTGVHPVTGTPAPGPFVHSVSGARGQAHAARGSYVERHVLPDGSVITKSRAGVLAWDVTTSPPKSVSVAWALATPSERAEIEAVLADASSEALGYLIDRASWSRRGRNGVEPIRAVIPGAAAFPHTSSRHGAPQVHVHHLIPARVQCEDGVWRALDGTELLAHTRATGAVYQAALREAASRRLGWSWGPVSEHGQAEILGIPDVLVREWSTRRASITDMSEVVLARANLARARAGQRPLDASEEARLRQRVTLRNRPAKAAAGRDLHGAALATALRGADPDLATLQRERIEGMTQDEWWLAQAARLGWSPAAVKDAVWEAAQGAPTPERLGVDIDGIAVAALDAAGSEHATFARRHVEREVAARLPWWLDRSASSDVDVRGLVDQITDRALGAERALQVTWAPGSPVPGEVTDPERVKKPSQEWWTTREGLEVEQRIIERAVLGLAAGRGVVADGDLLAALGAAAESGRPLDASQTAAVIHLGVSGDAIQVVEAPAGTGKTTMLATATAAWEASGYRVVGLAPTAQAAHVMAEETGAEAVTVDRALSVWGLREQSTTSGVERSAVPAQRTPADDVDADTSPPGERDPLTVDACSIVVVDEAAMVSRSRLDALTRLADERGAKVVLVGDSAQLSPVRSAGGTLLSLTEEIGALRLTKVHRFAEEWEQIASLDLRAGKPSAAREYAEHDRLESARDHDDALTRTHAQWQDAIDRGQSALMLASTHTDVDALNALAREVKVARGEVRGQEAVIGDRVWQRGDVLVATQNDGRLRIGGPSWMQVRRAEAAVIAIKAEHTRVSARVERAWGHVRVVERLGGPEAVERAARLRAAMLTRKRDRLRVRTEDARTRAERACAEWQAAPAIRNWQRFEVVRVEPADRLRVREIDGDGKRGREVVLPRTYVAQHARYGYASTVHSAQGSTVDAAVLLVDAEGSMSREQAYVGLTRGRTQNLAIVSPGREASAVAEMTGEPAEVDAVGVLSRVLVRRGGDISATTRIREAAKSQERLDTVAARRERVDAEITSRSPQVDRVTVQVMSTEVARLRGVIQRKTAAGLDVTWERGRYTRAAADLATAAAALDGQATWAADHPEITAYAANLAAREATRRTAVMERARQHPTVEVVASLGECPTEPGAQREAWDRAAGLAATYAERWGHQPEQAGPLAAVRAVEARAVAAAKGTWERVSRGLDGKGWSWGR